MAGLVGAKWGALTGQEKIMIFIAVAANWTGLVLAFLGKGMGRIATGKTPIETGDTDLIQKTK